MKKPTSERISQHQHIPLGRHRFAELAQQSFPIRTPGSRLFRWKHFPGHWDRTPTQDHTDRQDRPAIAQ